MNRGFILLYMSIFVLLLLMVIATIGCTLCCLEPPSFAPVNSLEKVLTAYIPSNQTFYVKNLNEKISNGFKTREILSKSYSKNSGPQFRDTPPKRDTGIANEKDWGISLNEHVNESGVVNVDGSTWYRESGEDFGENGFEMGGQNSRWLFRMKRRGIN